MKPEIPEVGVLEEDGHLLFDDWERRASGGEEAPEVRGVEEQVVEQRGDVALLSAEEVIATVPAEERSRVSSFLRHAEDHSPPSRQQVSRIAGADACGNGPQRTI